MTFARFLLPLLLLLSPLGLASAQQIAPPKPISSAQNIQKPSAAEQLAEERDARREAEHKQAIAEATEQLTDAANSRLENWIGIYGLLIAAIAIVAGIYTRNEANEAKQQAEAAAKVAGEEATRAARLEMLGYRKEADSIMSSLRETHKEAVEMSDGMKALHAASPGDVAAKAPNHAQELELAERVRQILAKPKSEWSALDYRSLMLDADDKANWSRYVELAKAMAWNFDDAPDDLAYALFGIAYGATQLGQHEQAALAFETYLERCPDVPVTHRAVALNNLGSVLGFQAREASGQEQIALLERAEEKFKHANQIRSGGGSYGLACVAGQRSDAAKAAKWLRDAKDKGVNCPDCAHIAADIDFVSIRDTPEFQQAMIDIGCAPAKKPALRRKKT